MHLIDQSKDSEYFAAKALGSNEVYVVPAFAGLGAPYWDMYARGAIFGLTRDTGKDPWTGVEIERAVSAVEPTVANMEGTAVSGIAGGWGSFTAGTLTPTYTVQTAAGRGK
jgi:glycerol kinase